MEGSGSCKALTAATVTGSSTTQCYFIQAISQHPPSRRLGRAVWHPSTATAGSPIRHVANNASGLFLLGKDRAGTSLHAGILDIQLQQGFLYISNGLGYVATVTCIYSLYPADKTHSVLASMPPRHTLSQRVSKRVCKQEHTVEFSNRSTELKAFPVYVAFQEAAAAQAREEDERRRHELHLKKLQHELEAKKEEERR